jgi:hypothetical protein
MSYPMQLAKLASLWDEKSRDEPPQWVDRLNRLMFHAEYRFSEYRQFAEEGAFPKRLFNWIEGGQSVREKQALLLAAAEMTFIDTGQLRALYRDGFRRIVIPWLFPTNPVAVRLNGEPANVVAALRQYSIASITESFSFTDFVHENDLIGFPRPDVLGEDGRGIEALIPRLQNKQGILVFEDLVGTGSQALRVLRQLRTKTQLPIFFLALILFEKGREKLTPEVQALAPFRFDGAHQIDATDCLRKVASGPEAEHHGHLRALALATRTRVLEGLGEDDDPPSDEFGYKQTGGLLVTAHNSPNNSLPLFHHRAPAWSPLFRRVHKSKDGL